MSDNNLIQQAISRGYSIDEIADKLSQSAGMDPAEIRGRGYTSGEILSKLGYEYTPSGNNNKPEQPLDFDALKPKIMEALTMQGVDSDSDRQFLFDQMVKSGKLDPEIKSTLGAARDRLSSRNRSIGTVAKDTALDLGAGSGELVRGAGWLVGHVPGMREAGDGIQEIGRSAADFYRDKQSNELKAQQEVVGEAKGFSGTLAAAIKNPGVILSDIAQSLPGMALGMGAGSVAEKLVMERIGSIAAAEAAAKGMSNDASSQFVANAIKKATEHWYSKGSLTNITANAGTEALQTAGSTGADVEEFALKNGLSESDARALANRTATKAGLIDVPFGMIGAGVERKFLQGQMERGVRGAILNPAKEAAEEFGQSAGEEYFTKRGMQEVDPSVPMDMLGAGTRGALAGFGTGVAMHAAGGIPALANRLQTENGQVGRELLDAVEGSDFSRSGIDRTAANAFNPSNAQLVRRPQVTDIASAPSVDEAISTANAVLDTPSDEEIAHKAQAAQIDQERLLGQLEQLTNTPDPIAPNAAFQLWTSGANQTTTSPLTQVATSLNLPQSVQDAIAARDTDLLRPKTIAGQSAEALTDDQLSEIAKSATTHIDTRKSAMLELQARQQENNATKPTQVATQKAQTNDAQVGAEQATAPAGEIESLRKQLDSVEPFTEESVAVQDRLQSAVTADAIASVEAGAMPVYQVSENSFVTISPSAQNPGKVQVTRYNSKGVFGDSQYNNVEEAISSEGLWTNRRLSEQEANAAFSQSLQAESEYQNSRRSALSAEGVTPQPTAPANQSTTQVEQKPKQDRKTVYPEKDSALVAIAKLGGMDTKELLNNGFDQSDISVQKGAKVSKKTGQLGKAPFRAKQVGFNMPIHRNGGMSFDGMREALVQYGYLPEDASVNDAADLLRSELRGEPVYTASAVQAQAESAEADRQAMMEAEQSADDYNDLNDRQQSAADETADALMNDRDAFVRGMRLAGLTEDEINDAINQTFGSGKSNAESSEGSTESSSNRRDQEGAPDDEVFGGKESQEPDWLKDDYSLEGQTNEQAAAEFKQQQAEANKQEAEPPAKNVTVDQVDIFNEQGGLRFSKASDGFESSPDAEREFKETERAYGGREAYDRAVESGKTKLNYRQWVQVRTPRFKVWFGDWDIASSIPKRQASTFDDARLAAKAFQGKSLENTTTGMKAVVSRNNLDKMLNSKAVSKSESAQAHAFAVANLDNLFSSALIGWSKSDADGDPNIKAIHRFFTPVVRNGKAMLVKMTVKETAIENDPNPLYTVESVEFNEKSPAAQWVAAASNADGVDLISIRSAGDIISLANRVQNFNGEVSKVVDPKTGEPLVVYHGTGNLENLAAFDPALTGKGNDQIGSGFYFTTDRTEASGYTNAVTQNAGAGATKLGGDNSPGIASLFLSIKSPIVVEGSNLRDTEIELTKKQATEIIKRAPNIRDLDESPLGNWIDIWSVGRVTDKMIAEVAENYTGASLLSLEGDFFRDDATAFRQALSDIIGRDGVTQTFDNGKSHWVAWFPEQAKSATGNNGDFNPKKKDIRHSKGITTSTPLPQQTAERLIAIELGSTTLAKVLVDSGIVSFANSEEELKKLGGKLMVAWHGSPHDHDGFTTDKIGTGEGAQAYGSGLYFSSIREIAEYYRDSLSDGVRGGLGLAGVMPSATDKRLSYNSWVAAKDLSELFVTKSNVVQPFSKLDVVERGRMLAVVRRLMQDFEVRNTVVGFIPVDVVNVLGGKKFSSDDLFHNPSVLIDLLPVNANDLVTGSIPAVDILTASVALAAAKVHTGLARFDVLPSDFIATSGTINHSVSPEVLSKIPHPNEFVKGRLYQVELAPSEDEYLDWDKPLSEQSEKVKAALAESGLDLPSSLNGHELYKFISNKFADDAGEGTSKAYYKESRWDKAASDYLHSIGIRGIRYLDGTSRGTGEGSSNYVIFSDEDVSITAKYSAATSNTQAGYAIARLSETQERTVRAVNPGSSEPVQYIEAGGKVSIEDFNSFVNEFGAGQPVNLYEYKRKINDIIEEIESDWSNGNSDDYSLKFGPEEVYETLRNENEAEYFDEDGDLTSSGSDRFNEIERELSSKIAKEFAGEPERDQVAINKPDDMANVVHAYLGKLGMDTSAISGSGKSGSKYFTVKVDGEFKKVRISDHQIPVEYQDINGVADYEIALYDMGDEVRRDGRINSVGIDEAEAAIRAVEAINAIVGGSNPDIRKSQQQQILGATLPDGRIILNLGALTEQNFAGVFKHEGFHSTVRELVGEETWNQLMSQLETNLKAAKGNDWVTRANAAIPADTKASDRTEEIGAYAIEQVTNGAKVPNFIKRWVDSLLSAIRTALIRGMGGEKAKLWAMKNLKPQDLANLAIAGLKAKASGIIAESKRMETAYSVDLDPHSSFWNKIKSGEKFNTKELDDAYSIGRRGTVRNGRVLTQAVGKEMDSTDAATVTASWEGGIAGIGGGYFSVIKAGQLQGKPALYEYIIPKKFAEGIYLTDGQDLIDRSITTIHFEWVDGDTYRLDVSGVKPGSYAFDELEKIGRIDDRGDGYLAPVLDNPKTETRSFIQEGVRRLAIFHGDVPNIVQMGRDTGARAGSRETRPYSKDQVESKFSSSKNPSKRDNVRSMADKDTVAGTQAPTSAGDGSTGSAKSAFDWSRRDDGGFMVRGLPADDIRAAKSDSPLGWAKFNADGELVSTGSDWATKPSQDALNVAIGEAYRLADLWKNNPPKPFYFRFGKPPSSGKSKHAISGKPEKGTSVYSAIPDVWGNYRLDDSIKFPFYGMALFGRNAFEIEGRRVATGSDGEPILKDAKVVREISKEEIRRLMGVRSNEPSASAGSDVTNDDVTITAKYSRAKTTQNTLPEETKRQLAQRVTQDKFNRFDTVNQWAKENGVTLSEQADVYLAEERYHGRVSTRIEDFRENTVNPLIQKIQKAGFTMQDVADFLEAQHTQEANDRQRKIHGNPSATAAGVTDADAQAYLAKASLELKKLANEFRQITTDTRNLLLKSGVISQEMADAWDQTYKYYVPLKGGEDSQAQRTGSGPGMSVNGKQKRRLGHGKRDEHVIENILRDYERAVVTSEKNLVGQHLLSLAIEVNGIDPDLITVDKPVKRQVFIEGKKTYAVEYQGSIVASFENRNDASSFISFMGKNGMKIVVSQGDPSVQMMAVPMLQENEAMVYVSGKAVRVQINDEKLASAYKNLGVERLNMLLQAGRGLNNWLSKAYTGYNPEFVLVNLARDFTGGLINLTGNYGAGVSSTALKNYPKAFMEMLRYSLTGNASANIQAYRDNGGSTGAAYISDIERIGTDVENSYNEYVGVLENVKQGHGWKAARAAGRETVGRLLGWIEHLNAASENAMRLAAFMAVRDKTGSLAKAASAAKNVTVNFNRKGEIGSALGAAYLFANPNIQGTAALFKTLFKGEHKYQAWALVGGMTMLAILSSMQFDDDEWDEIPDYEKDRNLLIRVGDTRVKIPVPYGYGFFFGLGNVYRSIESGENVSKVAMKLSSSFFEHFSPVGNPAQSPITMLPTAAKIALEPWLNINDFGRKIVPEYKDSDGKPDFLKMSRSTKGSWYDTISRAANGVTGGTKATAGWIDVSPETLKYWTKTLTGGTGAFYADLLHYGNLVYQDAKPEFNETPVVRKFVSEPRVNDVRQNYYQQVDEANKAMDAFNAAKKEADREGMSKIAQDVELLALAKASAHYRATIKAMRDAQDRVLNDESKTLAERRLSVKLMERKEEALYRHILEGVQD